MLPPWTYRNWPKKPCDSIILGLIVAFDVAVVLNTGIVNAAVVAVGCFVATSDATPDATAAAFGVVWCERMIFNGREGRAAFVKLALAAAFEARRALLLLLLLLREQRRARRWGRRS